MGVLRVSNKTMEEGDFKFEKNDKPFVLKIDSEQSFSVIDRN